MSELVKILQIKRPKLGITELFQSRLRELLDPSRFTVSRTPATAAFTVTIDRDGVQTPVTIRVMKQTLGGEPLFTITWTRTVHYEGLPESDDSYRGHHSGSFDVVTETRRSLDGLPQEVQTRARELAKSLDDQLKDAWRQSVRDFLDYYDLDDWERLREDVPDLDPAKARRELESMLN